MAVQNTSQDAYTRPGTNFGAVTDTLFVGNSPQKGCCAQGGVRIANEYRGSIFFEMSSGLGLTRYVSGRLSKYGNGISIYV